MDGTSGKNKKDDRIPFGATRTLQWHMTEDFAPRDDDPNCLPMAYHSHNLPAAEINSGLIGLIIVCKPGKYNRIFKPTLYEPRHEKTCLCHMRTTKAQISLRICAV